MLVLDLKHESEKKCLVCDRIKQIKENKNPYFVAELETGYVVMGDFQFFKGYTLLLCKEHITELHELKPDFKTKFLQEMTGVAEAVFKAFKPEKLNYELLGNADPHMHWHIFPRHKNDPDPGMATWCINKAKRSSDNVKPTKKELNILKAKLLIELEKTTKIVSKANDIPLPDIYNL